MLRRTLAHRHWGEFRAFECSACMTRQTYPVQAAEYVGGSCGGGVALQWRAACAWLVPRMLGYASNGRNLWAFGRTSLQGDNLSIVTRKRTFSTDDRKAPPADWYKRGAWIDAAEIERRMVDKDGPSSDRNTSPAQKEPDTAVSKRLKALIKYRGGTIPVAEYMKEVLTNPLGGFYAARGAEAIGKHGHFITSPEISGLFGEVLGFWVYQVWESRMGRPERFALVELGPGKGTLMKQMIAALKSSPHCEDILSALQVHFVEVSSDLRRLQHDALSCSDTVTFQQASESACLEAKRTKPRTGPSNQVDRSKLLKTPPRGSTTVIARESDDWSESRVQAYAAASPADRDLLLSAAGDAVVKATSAIADTPVLWHYSLNEVPEDMPAVIIGQEYLDALPIHQFVLDPKRGWLEVLVRESEDPQDPRHFEFVLSPQPTYAAQTLLKWRMGGLQGRKNLKSIEVNPQAMATAEAIARRVAKCGGAALFIDYGQDGPYEQSLNAIRHHGSVHVLEEPGSSDVTAWVDFDALRQAVRGSGAKAVAVGPVSQGLFLMAMRIAERADMLLQKDLTPEQRTSLEDGFARLVGGTDYHPQGMGETFKVMAIVPSEQPPPWPFDVDLAALVNN